PGYRYRENTGISSHGQRNFYERILDQSYRSLGKFSRYSNVTAVTHNCSHRIEADDFFLLKSKIPFQLQYTSNGLVKPRFRISAFLYTRDDSIDGVVHIDRLNENVDACRNGAFYSFIRAKLLQHTSHVHRVGYDHAFEAQLTSKHVRHDLMGQRSWDSRRI